MSGTTPPPGSGPGEDDNPYAQSGQGRPQEPPWASTPPPSGPPAWSGPADGAASAWGDPAPVPSEPPSTIRRAVMLMFVGAGISAVYALILLLAGDGIRDSMRDSIDTSADLSQADVDSFVDAVFGITIGLYVIAILLWLWMASANRKGRGWARILSTVLGALYILFSLFNLTGGGLNLVLAVVSIGLAGYILYLLYRPESSAYYAAVSGKRR